MIYLYLLKVMRGFFVFSFQHGEQESLERIKVCREYRNERIQEKKK